MLEAKLSIIWAPVSSLLPEECIDTLDRKGQPRAREVVLQSFHKLLQGLCPRGKRDT